jgi:hypothetical protein
VKDARKKTYTYHDKEVPMSRLESIKERMKMNENSLDCDLINLSPDVEYLLQRLERYENILRALDEVLDFSRERDTSELEANLKFAFNELERDCLKIDIAWVKRENEVLKLAKEALKE